MGGGSDGDTGRPVDAVLIVRAAMVLSIVVGMESGLGLAGAVTMVVVMRNGFLMMEMEAARRAAATTDVSRSRG